MKERTEQEEAGACGGEKGEGVKERGAGRGGGKSWRAAERSEGGGGRERSKAGRERVCRSTEEWEGQNAGREREERGR